MFIRVKKIETEHGKDTVRVLFQVAPTKKALDAATSMSEFGVDMPAADAPKLGAIDEVFS